MATQVQWRGGSTAEHATFTGAAREVTVDTQKKTLVVHDGSTAGGAPLMKEDGSNSALALGSAAAPSIKFTGDPNTGIYSPGADQLALSTNGTGRLFVDASGRVGIGTTPSLGFNVNEDDLIVGDGAGSRGITIYSSSTDNGGLLFADGTTGTDRYVGGLLYRHGDNSLAISTAAVERLRITSGGSVGIGTQSPGTLIDGASSGVNAELRLTRTDAATAGSLTVGAGNTTNNIYSTGVKDLTFSTNTLERARIDSSGRLLVGTSNAVNVGGYASANIQSYLQSSSATSAAIISTGDNAAGSFLHLAKSRGGTSTRVAANDTLGAINFAGADGTDIETPAARITAEVDGTPGANDMPGRLVFSTWGPDSTTSPTERMRIVNNGRLDSFATNATYGIYAGHSGAAGTTQYFIACGYSATAINTGTISFRVSTNGDVQNANNSYGAISDIKLKENIVDANSQWSDIKALQVRKYNFKEGQTHTQIGLVAQEVELVSPGLVSESPDRDEDGNDLGTVTKSVNYSVLYMKAVKALQEAMERIETLEASNTDLLARVSALESA